MSHELFQNEADTSPNRSLKANKRGSARLAAVQALYQMDMVNSSLDEIFASFETLWIGKEIDGDKYLPADIDYFRFLVQGTLTQQKKIDVALSKLLATNWTLKRMESVSRAILRVGAFEILTQQNIPISILINEYCDIAAAFLEKTHISMINAMLENFSATTRTHNA